MSLHTEPGRLSLRRQAAERVDRQCVAFEDAWQSGGEPDLETWLVNGEVSERAELFRELLLVDCEYRRKRGQALTADQYAARFPDFRALIDQVLGQHRVEVSGELLPGQQIGRYVVEQALGSGSFGHVYLAWDQELRRCVALKTPRVEGSVNLDAMETFIEEARTASHINHPVIVPVLDVIRQPNGIPVIVMAYIDGCSLRDRIRLQQLSVRECVDVLIQVADAIDFAHRRGFVHRDLKPHNILFDGAGRPHITDFGLAIHERDQYARAGESAGSLPYMSPELLRGDSQWLDGRSDIWALGVMLYEMLTRRLPFGGGTVDEMSVEIFSRDPKPPRQINADIPPEVERICLTCLAKRMGDRFATAGDLAAALRHTQQEQPGRDESLPGDRKSPPPRTWRERPALVITLVVLACVAAVSSLLCLNRGDSPSSTVAATAPGTAVVNDITLSVWSDSGAYRGLVSRTESSAIPLRAGDRVRLNVDLNRPAYMYVFWVGTDGEVTPVYPGHPGEWNSWPETRPVRAIQLPSEADAAWPVVPGAGGSETIIVAVTDQPLPRNADLESRLRQGEPQTRHRWQSPQWFHNGRLIAAVEHATRGPAIRSPVALDHPVITNQLRITRGLAPHEIALYALCFPIEGD
ncbi:MAG: serine/threonine-protein kinase [Pirellulaceae bacterium]